MPRSGLHRACLCVARGEGTATVARGEGLDEKGCSPGIVGAYRRIAFDTAHVELRTADRMLMFDFDQSVRPETLKDPLAQASWGLGFAPRSYTVGLVGEYEPTMRTDAQAEAMGVIVDGVVRFPARQVNVGDTWSTEWAGVRRQTETAGFFRFTQTAEFQQMIPGPSPRARIGYTTRGRIEISPERNKQQEETTVEGKGWILRDLQTGTVVGLDASGTITMNLKTPGITITRTMTASY